MRIPSTEIPEKLISEIILGFPAHLWPHMCMKLFGTSTPGYSRRNNYYFWHRAIRKLSAWLYPASTVSKSTYKKSRSVFYTKKSKLHSWNSYPRKQSVYPLVGLHSVLLARGKNGPGLHRMSLKTRICRDIKWCNRLCSCSRICGCHNFGWRAGVKVALRERPFLKEIT